MNYYSSSSLYNPLNITQRITGKTTPPSVLVLPGNTFRDRYSTLCDK